MKTNILRLDDLTNNFIVSLSKIKTAYLIALCIFFDLVISVALVFFVFPQLHNPIEKFSLVEQFIYGVIIAPILETWLVQGGIIHQLMKRFNNSKFIAIVFSSILFGLGHFFILSFSSVPFIIKGIFAGFLYAILFFSVQPKTKNPLLVVMVAHSIFNLIGFLIDFFSKS